MGAIYFTLPRKGDSGSCYGQLLEQHNDGGGGGGRSCDCHEYDDYDDCVFYWHCLF